MLVRDLEVGTFFVDEDDDLGLKTEGGALYWLYGSPRVISLPEIVKKVVPREHITFDPKVGWVINEPAVKPGDCLRLASGKRCILAGEHWRTADGEIVKEGFEGSTPVATLWEPVLVSSLKPGTFFLDGDGDVCVSTGEGYLCFEEDLTFFVPQEEPSDCIPLKYQDLVFTRSGIALRTKSPSFLPAGVVFGVTSGDKYVRLGGAAVSIKSGHAVSLNEVRVASIHCRDLNIYL